VVKASGNYVGFVDTGGSFASIASAYKYTVPAAINASGKVVGTYYGSDGIPFGFTYSAGTLTTLSNPSALPTAINDSGTITGNLGDNGFVDIGGVITAFSADASAVFTDPTGINSSGEIAGYYRDGSNLDHGFVDIGGVFTTLDVPGAVKTDINAINDIGTVTGYYTDSLGNVHGFIASAASVPEPGSVALLLTALTSLGFVRVFRGRA